MAKRTLAQMADLVEDIVDKSQSDTTFDTFVQNMLVLTLQEIIAEVPWARWLKEEHSITLTADQQYVTMPSDLDIDAIASLRDDTNNRKVERVSDGIPDIVDPGRDLSGSVLLWWFQRVGGADRLYFLPKPDAADSLTLVAGEIITDPTSAQTTALPAKYENVWLAKTMPKVWSRVDPNQNVDFWILSGERGMDVIRRDANSSPGDNAVVFSHRPGIGVPFTHGTTFPADFDVSP